jgi:hypothetical protein
MSSARIRREFLGWLQPPLAEAARRLAARYRRGEALTLHKVIVVVPGQRAGRRLKELLTYVADEERLHFVPPAVITEGGLPELLYTPQRPFADDLTQDLAWAQAWRELPADLLSRLLPVPPPPDESLRWLALGKMLRGLHTELAADSLNFAAVARRLPKNANAIEGPRWQALAALQKRYLALLENQNLWDKQTARLIAIEKREIRTEKDVILLGTVDLNQSLRHMLDQVAGRVTAYVVAPAELADHFDAHGCLVPEVWCAANVPVRDVQLQQVDGPQEQADAVSAWLSEQGARYRSDQVAVGVPDESLVPQLQRQLKQCDVKVRWVEGTRLGATLPYQLLAAAAQFAGQRRYADLAALLRHPDMEEWLTESPVLPTQLDRFYNRRLPSVVRAGSIPQNKDWPDLPAALTRIDGWLKLASTKRPLRNWGKIFSGLLEAVYGDRTLNVEQPADEILQRTLRKMLDECDRLTSLPAEFDAGGWSAADAFQASVASLAQEWLPPRADPQAVEILGWLELPLDDSQAVIVTSFNEGFVPKSTRADAFLPDHLRHALGLLNNERRYARDAYATSVLCHGRPELRILFARRNLNNDPLQPSRLIFACHDDVLVERAGRYFKPRTGDGAPRRLLLGDGQKIPETSAFTRPEPEPPGKKLECIRVTQFRDYLACPYRYYLKHVRELEAIDDGSAELDGRTFGTLLHKVLGRFGREPDGPRYSENVKEVLDFLLESLEGVGKERYGSELRRPAVRLQFEQARVRLCAFALHQTDSVRKGWRIAYAEDEEKDTLSYPFDVDDGTIKLIGRIDRIDVHEKTGTLLILDYKTGDTALTPEKSHRKATDWIDLQLPLYRHLRRRIPLDVSERTVQLGYFNLPKNAAGAGIEVAEWDEAILESADAAARRVIRNLRNGIYSPLANPSPKYFSEYSAICLENTRPPALAEEDVGEHE